MSSFRIDRQYVSFETAETQPVHPTMHLQKPMATPPDDSGLYGAEISRMYDKIYERLLQEHAEQAELMLSNAADEARLLVEKAQKQAEKIMIEAAEEAANAKADADRARDEQLNLLEAEYKKRIDEEEKKLHSLGQELSDKFSELVDGMQGQIVVLVMEIVRKIIDVKLEQTDDTFLGLIKGALERLKLNGAIVIRVGPEDYVRYFGKEFKELVLDANDAKISVVEEPNFRKGDLVVESECEMIDLSIDRQIGLVENAFLN